MRLRFQKHGVMIADGNKRVNVVLVIKTFTRWDLAPWHWDMWSDKAIHIFGLFLNEGTHASFTECFCLFLCLHLFLYPLYVNIQHCVCACSWLPPCVRACVCFHLWMQMVSLAQCLSDTQCLFMPREDLPLFLSPVHWEHCPLCSLIGMLKSLDIFVFHFKEGIKPSYCGLMSWAFKVFSRSLFEIHPMRLKRWWG